MTEKLICLNDLALEDRVFMDYDALRRMKAVPTGNPVLVQYLNATGTDPLPQNIEEAYLWSLQGDIEKHNAKPKDAKAYTYGRPERPLCETEDDSENLTGVFPVQYYAMEFIDPVFAPVLGPSGLVKLEVNATGKLTVGGKVVRATPLGAPLVKACNLFHRERSPSEQYETAFGSLLASGSNSFANAYTANEHRNDGVIAITAQFYKIPDGVYKREMESGRR